MDYCGLIIIRLTSVADAMNKYLEERCIGRGSYGCAYLVTEVTSGHKYVVKKIPIELMTDKESKQAFAEVELLSKLHHSFVVQYKENFVEGTVLHIVMEYCDGGDLTARIKALKADDAALFPPTLVLDWFVQMALAIKYLHQRHILHRDLKTSNIFLTRQNIVKLGDFGIARTLDSTMDHAKTVVGTPYYMSPEVCESKPYSYASDIWALGCVLYEVCTLKHAFDAPNILMLIVKIIQHDNFYSDDSDFDDEDLTLETSVDEVVACGGGGGWLSGARQVSAAVELGYIDDFDDTEAEVIEYDNEEFVDDGSSGGSSYEEQGGGDKVDWYNYDEFADPSPPPPLYMATPSRPIA
ncbi:hypothetical protein DYB28_003246 [Aphanomyces astaci]|uniref:non-specific serine/threonine protein kinase n=1 Tax=Aphanomyces astaci TaxID=112090 RepID=A0A9X8DNI5_APHAT|nr:hypothetical protein DYB28_003246 [Aphanomyces astaci]